MGKSSIHIKRAAKAAVVHNSRDNHSNSVVFTDEKNELQNDTKQAYTIYRQELKKRTKAYTDRVNQKLQKNAITHLSAVLNLEQHHTLDDLQPIKEYLEKEFDTKVFQMSIHRDEGKLISKENSDLVYTSGEDFFLNIEDNQLYLDKKYTQKIDMSKYNIVKNYHAHIEMMGLDSTGAGIKRNYMNKYRLSQLQTKVAEVLKMERGKIYVDEDEKPKRRLDVLEFKRENKIKRETILGTTKKYNMLINDIVKKIEDKVKIKQSEIDKLKKDIEAQIKASELSNEEKKELHRQNRELQKELKEKNKDNELSIMLVETKVAFLMSDLMQKDTRVAELEKSVSDMKTTIEMKDIRVAELEASVENEKIMEGWTNSVENRPSTKKEVIDHLLNEKNRLEKSVSDMKTTIEMKDTKVAELEDTLVRKDNELLKKPSIEYVEKVVYREDTEKLSELEKVVSDMKTTIERQDNELSKKPSIEYVEKVVYREDTKKLSELEDTLVRKDNELVSLEVELDNFQMKLFNLETKLDEAEKKIDELTKLDKKRKANLKSISNFRDEINCSKDIKVVDEVFEFAKKKISQLEKENKVIAKVENTEKENKVIAKVENTEIDNNDEINQEMENFLKEAEALEKSKTEKLVLH